MTDLTSMANIGKEMSNKLKSVGINTAEELSQIGSKEAFFRLKMKYSNVCLVHLYTLEAAIENVKLDCLSTDMKADLKKFSDDLK